jgi:hypothetical protein
MGLTSSATSFTLRNRTVTDVGSPVDGAGKKGPYLGIEGHVTYYMVFKYICCYYYYTLMQMKVLLGFDLDILFHEGNVCFK